MYKKWNVKKSYCIQTQYTLNPFIYINTTRKTLKETGFGGS